MNEPTESIIDAEWRALANRAKLEIVNDDEYDQATLAENTRDSYRPIGCYPSSNRSVTKRDLWVCKFYIGRKQRILGWGSCYQMTRLYDAALSCFAQYRTKKFVGSIYNFSQSPSPDIDVNAAAIVSDMETLLLEHGRITTADERAEYSTFRRANRAHKYTQRARVEELLTVISASIDDCNTRLSAIEKQLGELANRQTAVIAPRQQHESPPDWNNLPTDFSSGRGPKLSVANKSPWVDLLTTDKPVVS